MKSFLTMLLLFLKNRLRSKSFIGVCLAVLLFTASFSALIPKSAEPSAKVGLIFENSDQRLYQSCCNLLNLQEMTFIRYYDEQLMQNDVMNGTLHCGYKIDMESDPPIKIFETSGSILAPVLDELVFSAWFEAHMLNTAPDLYGPDYSALIGSEIERLSIQNKPLAVDVTVTSADRHSEPHFETMLYSVFIPLTLLSAVFCAILSPASEKDAVKLILNSTVNRSKAASALFMADVLLFFAKVIIFESFFALFSISNGFSFAARTVFALAAAIAAATLFKIFSNITFKPPILFWGIVWASVSIAFSGAFVSPELFGIFESVKYFSPSWLLLRLMSALTAF